MLPEERETGEVPVVHAPDLKHVFDNDGDLDILINNIDDTPTLLQNDIAAKAGHWLTVKLIGDVKQKCPREDIG